MRLFLALALAALSAAAQDVVFRGTPTVRVLSTTERDDRQQLSGDTAQKAECVIVQRGNKYYWRSRGDAPLNRVDLRGFTYFLHPQGLGFVKVLTGSRKEIGAPADYIESYTQGFETITYWGRVASPAP
jgi:hypothetical protein